MIGVLVLIAARVAMPVAEPEHSDVFACSLVTKETEEPSQIVDIRAERRSGSAGESWRLDWADGKFAEAQPFMASFGSIGESLGIKWTDADGVQRRAFVSYSDMAMPNGQKVMFLSLDKPLLWQPPGYVCSTAALKENRP